MLVKQLLTRNPFDLAREMDRLFDSMYSSQPFGFVPTIRAPWTFPSVNLWEDDENLYAEAELPGMTIDDLEVLVTADELTIKGTRKSPVGDSFKPLRRERPVGTFERSISLPMAVDSEAIEARLSSGVLTVTLPKVAECKPRRVEVKTLTDRS